MEIARVDVIVRAAPRKTGSSSKAVAGSVDYCCRCPMPTGAAIPPSRPDRRPRGGPGGYSRRGRVASVWGTVIRHQAPVHCRTLAMTPGCRRATTSVRSPARSCSGIGATSPLAQGMTRAVRRPDRSECSTQPSVPSASRMRRQVSNSAMISTGSPARWNTQAVRCSLDGPLAQVHPVGLEADVAGHRQAGDLARLAAAEAPVAASWRREARATRTGSSATRLPIELSWAATSAREAIKAASSRRLHPSPPSRVSTACKGACREAEGARSSRCSTASSKGGQRARRQSRRACLAR